MKNFSNYYMTFTQFEPYVNTNTTSNITTTRVETTKPQIVITDNDTTNKQIALLIQIVNSFRGNFEMLEDMISSNERFK